MRPAAIRSPRRKLRRTAKPPPARGPSVLPTFRLHRPNGGEGGPGRAFSGLASRLRNAAAPLPHTHGDAAVHPPPRTADMPTAAPSRRPWCVPFRRACRPNRSALAYPAARTSWRDAGHPAPTSTPANRTGKQTQRWTRKRISRNTPLSARSICHRPPYF